MSRCSDNIPLDPNCKPPQALHPISVSQDSHKSGTILIKTFKDEVGKVRSPLKMVKLTGSDIAKVISSHR